MTLSVEQIMAEALSLPSEERIQITTGLVNSLGNDPDVDPEWYAEVLSRLEEIRSGTAEMIPGEEFSREIEDYLRERLPASPKGTR